MRFYAFAAFPIPPYNICIEREKTMTLEDKFVRLTGPDLKDHPQFNKAGIVLEDYEDGTVLVYFKGRQRLVFNVSDLTVLDI